MGRNVCGQYCKRGQPNTPICIFAGAQTVFGHGIGSECVCWYSVSHVSKWKDGGVYIFSSHCWRWHWCDCTTSLFLGVRTPPTTCARHGHYACGQLLDGGIHLCGGRRLGPIGLVPFILAMVGRRFCCTESLRNFLDSRQGSRKSPFFGHGRRLPESCHFCKSYHAIHVLHRPAHDSPRHSNPLSSAIICSQWLTKWGDSCGAKVDRSLVWENVTIVYALPERNHDTSADCVVQFVLWYLWTRYMDQCIIRGGGFDQCSRQCPPVCRC
mmetsp:Transcript_20481/g.37105  ORF Transcript_20481/g.37105 Transcript_20481/m.37105 type:complete len:268 (+) Transcript_20481:688-1491(+)